MTRENYYEWPQVYITDQGKHHSRYLYYGWSKCCNDRAPAEVYIRKRK